MELGDLLDVVYTLWIQDFSAFEYSPKDVRKRIDEALDGESEPHLRAVPDRETWGSTPEDIQSQLAMQALVEKRESKKRGSTLNDS